ncbi:hypothetical protein QBC46DRAFT_381972 [Diplogelasinospora grovesii]|uniref:Uncharacterized protein n=1 Tax=Diplogelasinospora grovesii TaxID=303347 RepID=A0AAN6NAR9_9PEZI|nr:hypothetical protein QBC46DRAFT_381972 [Diplogelasinospora grovesii]
MASSFDLDTSLEKGELVLNYDDRPEILPGPARKKEALRVWAKQLVAGCLVSCFTDLCALVLAWQRWLENNDLHFPGPREDLLMMLPRTWDIAIVMFLTIDLLYIFVVLEREEQPGCYRINCLRRLGGDGTILCTYINSPTTTVLTAFRAEFFIIAEQNRA